MVGSAGAEKWTENGHALHELAEAAEMMVMNTKDNCAEPGWTWQRSDGKGKGRIDYLLVNSQRANQVVSNTGAVTWAGLEREGSTVDHRPVQAVFNFKLLDEVNGKKIQFGQPGQMTQFNNTLSQAFDACRTHNLNQFTMNKMPVNREHLEVAHNMRESFRNDIEETWNAEDSVDNKVEKLDRAATNVYNELCRKTQHRPVKQKYLTEEIVEDVYECNRQ